MADRLINVFRKSELNDYLESAEKTAGWIKKYEISDEILSEYFTNIMNELEVDVNGEKIYINHYPTNRKPQMMNIVGHIHVTWKVKRNMINVGVDAWHFVPVSEDLIKFQINGIRNHYDENVFMDEIKINDKK